jgi:WD40 repeat protein
MAEISDAKPQPGPELFPVGIGVYQRPELRDLQVEAEVGRVLELLADFEPVYRRWPGRADQRDATAVQQRLLTWAQPDQPGNSLLYWVGHGWSDDDTAALAHSASPPEVRTFGVSPEQLADAVISRQLTADGAWAIVVIDACRSDRFVELMAGAMYRPAGQRVKRVLLVGVSADGATTLGRFSRALERLLGGTYQDRTSITLSEIGKDLGSQLSDGVIIEFAPGDAALVRAAPPAASLSGPLDSIRYLEDALKGLSADERRHFLSKAQSAEDGEISWFFEGRQDECAEVVSWLAGHDHGIMVVTGPAGTGKSALLGNLLVHSLPDVRSALLRRGLIDPLPRRCVPADHAFDHALHLSGLTIRETVSKIAEGAGCGPLPSAGDPLLGLANDLDWLHEELRQRGARYTLLADALDEAVDPLDTARVLARLAADTSLRIILGTRPSTAETPDHPASDDNLLHALALSGTPTTVRSLGQDPAAVRRYVLRRLREARDHPGRRRTPISDYPPPDESIDAAATRIAERNERFLFARLAVHELINDPFLLEPGRSHTLRQLLSGTHRDLFAGAVARLGREHDAFVPLIQALALAKGRGLPIEDDVWGTAAAALVPGAAEDGTDRPVDRSVIQELIDHAPAYVAVGSEAGQTVYRLAHRTFVEYFLPPSVPAPVHRQQCQAVAAALLRAAVGQAPLIISNYLRRYLSAHVAEAELWDELGGQLSVLDGLDPDAMAADIAASLFGNRPVPAQLAGVLSARPRLVDADPADRAGLRQLAVLTHDPAGHVQEPTPTWGVAAAALQAEQVHLIISGHDGGVGALRPVRAEDGRELLVSAGFDGTVRMWDPVTAAPIGDPMTGHDGTIEDVCVLAAGESGSQLATAGDDGTIRLWDPVTAQPVGRPMTGHDGSIWELCAVPAGRSGQLLVSAGNDRTLRVWDPRTCAQVGPPLTGHDGGVLGLCPLWMNGAAAPLIVSASDDGSVRLWDPLSGQQIGEPMIANGSQVWMVQAVRTRDRGVLVAATGIDGVVRLWDPSRQELVGSPLLGHGGPVWRGCAIPDPRGGDRLATAGGEGDIWLWDLAPGGPVGRPMRGHVGTVWGVCGLTGQRPGAQLLASAGADGTIRIWDTTPTALVPESAASGPIPVTGVTYMPEAGPRPVIAATRTDGSVRRWNPVTGVPVGAPLTGHDGPVWAACTVRLPDGRVLIVTAGNDGSIRRWDPETAEPVGPPLTDHAGAVWSICRVALSEDQERVVTTSSDGTVRLWNMADPQPVGTVLIEDVGSIYASCATPTRADAVAVFSVSARGDLLRWESGSGATMAVLPSSRHPGAIIGICPLPSLDGVLRLATASDDGTVRVWDPVTGSQVGAPMIDQSGCMWDICFLPTPRGAGRLATISDDGGVRQWDLDTGQRAGPVLSGHVGQGWGICTLPSGLLPGEETHLASGGQDGTVCVWDPFSARLRGAPLDDSDHSVGVVRLTASDAAGLTCLLVTRDGALSTWRPGQRWWRPAWRDGHVTTVCLPDPADSVAVIGCTDGSLHTVDLTSTAPAQPPAPPSAGGAVLALAPAPDGTTVWVGYDDGTVRQRNFRAAHWAGPPMRMQDGPVQSLCVMRTAQALLLACGGQDGQITLVDLADGVRRDELPTEPGNWIWSMCSLPMPSGDPDLLVSASSDHLVRLWDPATRRPAGEPLAGHAGQVRAVAAVSRQDGATLLASGGTDGNVCLWHPGSRQLVKTIPIGLPICDLVSGIGDPAAQRRTDRGAIIVVGTTQGIIAIDLNANLFTAT